MQQFYAAKDARQEALELEMATLAARATQQEKLQQFYARKEAQMDAFGLPKSANP
jgi:hypothetical protein